MRGVLGLGYPLSAKNRRTHSGPNSPKRPGSSTWVCMPLAVTMAAALFMQEQVGWRRWTAIAVGFAGVMLVIRP